MTWTACKHGGPSPDVTALSEALTAAQKRIVELETNITAIGEQLKAERETARRAGITYDAVRDIVRGYVGDEVSFGRMVEQLRDLCLANTRVAELEDWQRRASESLDFLVHIHRTANMMSRDGAEAEALLREVKP